MSSPDLQSHSFGPVGGGWGECRKRIVRKGSWAWNLSSRQDRAERVSLYLDPRVIAKLY